MRLVAFENRAAMRRNPFNRDPHTPQQQVNSDSDSLASSGVSSGGAYDDARNDSFNKAADTPGSITSPRIVDRSPLQGRTLNTLLGINAVLYVQLHLIIIHNIHIHSMTCVRFVRHKLRRDCVGPTVDSCHPG